MAKETLIDADSLDWRASNLMQIPNADFLERTGSQAMGARLWKLPPHSANTHHRHITAEEFYFVLDGVGRIRVDGQTYTLRKHEAIHVWPEQMRQVFNDTNDNVTWLIVGAPDNEMSERKCPNFSEFYPTDPKELPPEMHGLQWPKQEAEQGGTGNA